jgi:hypothetical protein
MPHLRELRLDDVTVQLGAVAGCPGVLHDCSGLTALDLQECVLEDLHAAFAAIAALPELQSLQIKNCQGPADALALPELLPDYVFERLPPTGAFTALTASTNLRSLHLQGRWEYLSGGCVLFKPGAVYPHLCCIKLQAALCSGTVDDSEQQLQQLCSSCPALEDLSFRLWWDPSPTACTPLLQLPALTHLDVYGLRSEAVKPAAVVDVAAQLTGLQHLKLSGLAQLTSPALLQLTALAALECLELSDKDNSMRLFNEVSPASRSLLLAGTAGQLDMPVWHTCTAVALLAKCTRALSACSNCQQPCARHNKLWNQTLESAGLRAAIWQQT